MIGAGGLGGDRSGTLRNMLGLTDSFYNELYKGVMGKVSFTHLFIYLLDFNMNRIINCSIS